MIAEAEEALWTLTAAEQPDAAAIDSKVREIEKAEVGPATDVHSCGRRRRKLLTADQQRWCTA